MSDAPQNGQSAAVPAAARLFAAFCFVLALLGFLSFWPPKSSATVVWLLIWTLVSVAPAWRFCGMPVMRPCWCGV